MSRAYRDLRGQKFGKLLAIKPTKKRSCGSMVWLCRCDCGNLVYIQRNGLVSERTKSCGCLKLTHGDTCNGEKTRLYRIWHNMKQRCYNPNNEKYKYYGGKGIAVCNQWKNNYFAFKTWALANGYVSHLTIDRIKSNGNYEPLNCQWLTRSENTRRRGK